MSLSHRCLVLGELFSEAVAEFENGRFASAEESLKNLDRGQRRNPGVLHLLGLIALETDQPQKAVENFRRLIKAQPKNDQYHALYGSALLRCGKAKQSITAFERAIKIDPEPADYYYNRAKAEIEDGNTAGAEAGFREALRRDPDHQDGRFELGKLLRQESCFGDALACFEIVLQVERDAVDALIEIGETLIALKRFEEALPYLQRAMALAPQSIHALNTFAIANYNLKRYDVAERAIRDGLALSPDSFHLHNSLGNLNARRGRLTEAEQNFRDAMALAPHDTEIALTLAGLLLLTGALEDGWKLSEHMRAVIYGRKPSVKFWDGSDLSGKTIRAFADQGVGDVVMFAGLLPELQSRAERCIIEIDERLVPLFGRSFPNIEIIGRQQSSRPSPCGSDIDFETIFSELPRYLLKNLDLATAPAQGYLKANPAKSAEIRRRYKADDDRLLVGIAWRSHNPKRPKRNAPLALWGPIFALRNARFVSIQYGDVAKDIADAERCHGVDILVDPEIDQIASLDDLASQIDALDLVVSISQAGAHFAGALGKTVLTMIPNLSDWRYRLTGDRTIWYPNMTLFRQPATELWDDTIEAVARDIARISKDSSLVEP